MRKLLIPAAAAGALLIGTTLTTLAGPKQPDVPAHRHFIQHADGTLVEVGPRLCDNPKLQNAFNNFHYNVHVPSGAPGLHNGRGSEIVARACSFQAP
jgi:hypothetical protein